MTSHSKAQQKLFGWALAYKQDKTINYPENVKELSDSMSESELEKYSITKHSDLPEHVKENVIEFLNNINDEQYSSLLEAKKEQNIEEGILNEDGEGAMTSLVDVPKMGDVNPPVTPGMDKSGSGDTFPGLFRPSTFKMPMKKGKHTRRIMDFDEFLKRINYATHDGDTQYGSGKNKKAKG